MKHRLLPGGSCHDSCCLKIENLSVRFGTDPVLEDVNLHMHCGQIVALIGPNGAGKSTLIKAILGQRDYEGKIVFTPAGGPEAPLRIGYVPQSPAFDGGDPISVQDLFGCCLTRRPAFLRVKKEFRQKVLECLSRVHGESLIDKRIGDLSGGELQRVLLALALEPMPQLLILDEPLSGVDVDGMALLMDMLDEIRKKYDLSILMTTHDFSMLEQYCDRVVLLALALEPMPQLLILDEPLSGVDVEGMALLMDMLDEIRKKYDLSILMTTHDFSMLEQYCDRVVLLSQKILKKGTPLEVLSSEEFLSAFRMGGYGQ